MSQYSRPEATFPPPTLPVTDRVPTVPARLPVQASKAKSALRISAGVVSIAVGFWGSSAAMALTSMSALLGPRFAWLGFLLGFAAFCSVVTGFVQMVRHSHEDLRVPALSMAFAAINVIAYVAVYVAFPIATPMLGGLVASALAIVLIALTMVFDTWLARTP